MMSSTTPVFDGADEDGTSSARGRRWPAGKMLGRVGVLLMTSLPPGTDNPDE